ncbi:MAG: hypothetical protein DCC48_18350, partial [Acidobacteria bacterium]
ELSWDATTGVPQVLTVDDGAGADAFVYGANRIGVDRADGTTGVFSYDPFGSAIRNPATADVVRADAYSPYGQQANPAFNDPLAHTPAFGYRGELMIDTTVHLRARTYAPAEGVFTTRDPLDGVAGTPTVTSPYHYTDNNPINKVDPTGRRPGDDQYDICPPGLHCRVAGGGQLELCDFGAFECRVYLSRLVTERLDLLPSSGSSEGDFLSDFCRTPVGDGELGGVIEGILASFRRLEGFPTSCVGYLLEVDGDVRESLDEAARSGECLILNLHVKTEFDLGGSDEHELVPGRKAEVYAIEGANLRFGWRLGPWEAAIEGSWVAAVEHWWSTSVTTPFCHES